MGGTLEVHEGDDASLLVVYLRSAGEGAEAAAPAPAPALPPGRPAPDGARPSWWTPRSDVQGRVLYVEDDPGNVEIVRHALRSRPQVELLVAHTVDDAERVLSREPRLHLLLVDLMLPGRGGQALLELRAATPALSSLPCVVLTSVDDLAQEEIARRLGADDYLVKPLRLERLLNLVDLHLAPAPT
jgi:response regulator RpfG family c-di-GMP phosphodiesterase